MKSINDYELNFYIQMIQTPVASVFRLDGRKILIVGIWEILYEYRVTDAVFELSIRATGGRNCGRTPC